MRAINKLGKVGTGWKVLGVLGIVAAVFVVIAMLGGEDVQQTTFTTSTSTGIPNDCPSDKVWSGTVDVKNLLNVSGAETYDTSAYFYFTGTNTLKTSITDTTAGAVTLKCGETYDVKVLSTSGAAGDSARIRTISGSDGAIVSADGTYATFTARGNGNRITLGMAQHAVPEVQIFSVPDNAFMTAADAGTGYNQTDGVSWNGTGASATWAIGTAGEMNLQISLRAVAADEDYNDLGIYVLVDAATTIYDKPTVKLDGAVLQDIKGQLNPDEAKAYSAYEYAYLIPASRAVTLTNKAVIGFNMFALGGVNPGATDNIAIDFGVRGSYDSVSDANLLKVGSVDDTTSQVTVYNLHDMDFDVS